MILHSIHPKFQSQKFHHVFDKIFYVNGVLNRHFILALFIDMSVRGCKSIQRNNDSPFYPSEHPKFQITSDMIFRVKSNVKEILTN